MEKREDEVIFSIGLAYVGKESSLPEDRLRGACGVCKIRIQNSQKNGGCPCLARVEEGENEVIAGINENFRGVDNF